MVTACQALLGRSTLETVRVTAGTAKQITDLRDAHNHKPPSIYDELYGARASP